MKKSPEMSLEQDVNLFLTQYSNASANDEGDLADIGFELVTSHGVDKVIENLRSRSQTKIVVDAIYVFETVKKEMF